MTGDAMRTEAEKITSRTEAERLWDHGQEIAARLERAAEEAAEEADRDRLGDLADALRGL
jgi:hypothetical protein